MTTPYRSPIERQMVFEPTQRALIPGLPNPFPLRDYAPSMLAGDPVTNLFLTPSMRFSHPSSLRSIAITHISMLTSLRWISSTT